MGASLGRIIVIANEKGGAGKSTVTTHLIIAALKDERSVAVFDIDNRQQTTTRFFENRKIYNDANNLSLVYPKIGSIELSQSKEIHQKQQEDKDLTIEALKNAAAENDLVFVDCPGADTAQSRAAHGVADIIITPVNDSFIDFDLLAKIDPLTDEVSMPNFYSQMVWEAKKNKAIKERASLEWFVLRNRLSSIDARNKRKVGDAITKLSKRIGFNILPGLSERVIFRELFPKGLTIMDLGDVGKGSSGLSLSNVAARQEIRNIMQQLQL